MLSLVTALLLAPSCPGLLLPPGDSPAMPGTLEEVTCGATALLAAVKSLCYCSGCASVRGIQVCTAGINQPPTTQSLTPTPLTDPLNQSPELSDWHMCISICLHMP